MGFTRTHEVAAIEVLSDSPAILKVGGYDLFPHTQIEYETVTYENKIAVPFRTELVPDCGCKNCDDKEERGEPRDKNKWSLWNFLSWIMENKNIRCDLTFDEVGEVTLARFTCGEEIVARNRVA